MTIQSIGQGSIQNNRRDLTSPYHSDVSQSAPSSPTTDTYETIPLVDPFTSTWTRPGGRNAFETHAGEYTYDDTPAGFDSTGLTADGRDERNPGMTIQLIRLLQRLGIQSVWPCLREHNITELHRLSQLTRRDLIDMGVLDAETRATLMTAARILTDSVLGKLDTQAMSVQSK
ncbi:unnamed protein product [Echinostoma caproni]|uniref:SAM domain-containing protein n=1 Tax=Echinostoma caproni TaxID=27848 RepID=A0A183ASA1_9TREM|nr:unnamed protein product [Echinostoma caproni]